MSVAPSYCKGLDVMKRVQQLDSGKAGLRIPKPNEFPNEETLDEWITRTETVIDKFCRKTWKTIPVTIPEELHKNRGMFPMSGAFKRAIYVKLRNANIRTFETGEGDLLECYSGSSWVDFITERTEGRNADYEVDYKKGMIWLFDPVPLLGPNMIKVTYRYGELNVPLDITEACILLVASKVLNSDDFLRYFPSQNSNFSLPAKAQEYKKEAYQILKVNQRIITK